MKKLSIHLAVRYYETDQMAIVHHSNYIRYCEAARLNFLQEIGIDFPAFERSGFVSPVLGFTLAFKKPAVFGDTVTVTTWVKQMKGIRAFFAYEITNQNGELLVTGESEHTFCDRSLRPVALQKVHPEYYQKLHDAAAE